MRGRVSSHRRQPHGRALQSLCLWKVCVQRPPLARVRSGQDVGLTGASTFSGGMCSSCVPGRIWLAQGT